MNQKQAFETYSKTRVQTANPEQLVVLSYQGGIKYLNLAVQSLENQDMRQAHDHLVRAQNIVAELSMALDVNRGGEFALGLQRLYEYMVHRLVRANVEKDVNLVIEIRGMLEDLLITWRSAIKKDGENRTVTPGAMNGRA